MKKLSPILIFCISVFIVGSCSAQKSEKMMSEMEMKYETEELTPEQLAELETAYFAAGCFWCVEAIYQHLEGVVQVVSGFSGGEKPNPTYQEVASGQTHYAETVRVRFDPDVTTYRQLVDVFYASHNPTILNRVGPDAGPQYRSAIFYTSPKQKRIAVEIKNKIDASDMYDEPIVTGITEFEAFYAAGEHHQNYELKHPNDPYIVQVSIPRQQRTLKQFPQLVVEDENNLQEDMMMHDEEMMQNEEMMNDENMMQ